MRDHADNQEETSRKEFSSEVIVTPNDSIRLRSEPSVLDQNESDFAEEHAMTVPS